MGLCKQRVIAECLYHARDDIGEQHVVRVQEQHDAALGAPAHPRCSDCPGRLVQLRPESDSAMMAATTLWARCTLCQGA